MINFFIATALSLNTSFAAADTARIRIPPRTVTTRTTAAADSSAQGLPFGDDKLQHMFISYAVYSFSYGGDRALGMHRKAALIDAAVTAAVIGVGKELWDVKHHKRFSVADLTADAIGAFAGFAMLKNVR
jgi:hypothetical protein